MVTSSASAPDALLLPVARPMMMAFSTTICARACMCACVSAYVCVSTRACMCARVRAYVDWCGCEGVHARARVRSLQIHPT